MFLGYYKFFIQETFLSTYTNFVLRFKGNIIGRKCKISNGVIIKGKVKIGDNTYVGKDVLLNNGVVIGNNSKIENVEIGENSHIESGVIITGFGVGKIKIGKESYIGIYNILDWSDNIVIGNFVHIAGPSTGLWTHSSAKQALNGIALCDKNVKFRPTAPIIIEDYVYIGGNCTIYPGVTIGHHSIVAPNSTVTKDVESFTMVGGVPAKVIKKIQLDNI